MRSCMAMRRRSRPVEGEGGDQQAGPLDVGDGVGAGVGGGEQGAGALGGERGGGQGEQELPREGLAAGGCGDLAARESGATAETVRKPRAQAATLSG